MKTKMVRVFPDHSRPLSSLAQAVEVRGKRERGSVADASSEQARPFLSRSGVALRAAPRKAEGGDGR